MSNKVKDRLAFATLDILGRQYWLSEDDVHCLILALQSMETWSSHPNLYSLRTLFEYIMDNYEDQIHPSA